jgi:DNA-binding NtrC family response regulator
MAERRSQSKGWDAKKEALPSEKPSNVVLSISPFEEDRESLERIFESDRTKSDTTVLASATAASAISALQERSIPIVICDCDNPADSWTEILDRISLLPDPPLFIVSSRLADERLWAEALNLGAWDVLAKPFDADEVIRIVGIAWQHWKDRHGVSSSGAKPAQSAKGTGYLAATGT